MEWRQNQADSGKGCGKDSGKDYGQDSGDTDADPSLLATLTATTTKLRGLTNQYNVRKLTRILSEEAVITVNELVSSERLRTSICQQVEALSEHQRRAFLSMHNIHPYRNAAEQYLEIARTNSLPAEAVGDKGAIFLEACRINTPAIITHRRAGREDQTTHSACFERH
jgi:hypothetical protein